MLLKFKYSETVLIEMSKLFEIAHRGDKMLSIFEIAMATLRNQQSDPDRAYVTLS